MLLLHYTFPGLILALLLRCHSTLAQQPNQATQQVNPARSTSIRIRCAPTLQPGNEPFCVLNGRPISAQDLKSINPNEISHIEVLKSAQAMSIYGSRAAYGAFLITTTRKKQLPRYLEEKKVP
ncbi:TonB-dependent receptor plug domain-containing protein [Hymenobacter busanensis]|uniref:TonB-dependent receptor plug domain-containing protein n=1 Tax=Hymenobacter busanensis TaxID=2607656 RepID=A0A7L4ZUG4_9BACT|nr:TonB-dependent receptor plug domain-containing protein [Hymenobacter busanensis]KAA9339682.1 TonB-dependent receptor plug domain-containing protein [Hymenobacter busanensis]QHJ06563.1 TonB-dependent receptor plug domain-containing protein [Hymenobacter busanensis]